MEDPLLNLTGLKDRMLEFIGNTGGSGAVLKVWIQS